jgi:hypothetical protein
MEIMFHAFILYHFFIFSFKGAVLSDYTKY